MTSFPPSPTPQECLFPVLHFGQTQPETRKPHTYNNVMIMSSIRILFYQVCLIGQKSFSCKPQKPNSN